MARLIASPDFAQRTRHPDHPNAITRQRPPTIWGATWAGSGHWIAPATTDASPCHCWRWLSGSMGITNQRSKSHAADLTARLLAPVLLAVGHMPRAIHDAPGLLGRTAQKYIPGRSRPRPKHSVKPHPSVVYKG